MLKLFIGKSKDLDEKEIVVLAALNGMYSVRWGQMVTSIDCIGYFITGRFLKTAIKRDRTMIENIRVGIQSLAERKIITIIDKSEDNYVISNEGLDVNTDKEKFVVVELWEMQKIFSDSNKPFNVFLFFVNLVGTINNQTKEWHMSQDDMAALWGASKRTINDYLEQLEKMRLIYVYRHKKRRANGTYQKLNNSYGRYCDKDAIIAEAQKYSDTVECEDFVEKLDRRAIKLRYNAYCEGAKKYIDNPAAVITLYKECVAYNKSLKYKPVEGYYDGEYKQGELLDLSVFPDEVRNEADDNWGEPVSMEHDFSIEEILDMPTEGEVLSEPILTNMDCVGQDELCKANRTPTGVQFKTGDYKEPDYIEADKESRGEKIRRELFCINGKDSGYIDIDDLY